jgi:hypothetical protein
MLRLKSDHPMRQSLTLVSPLQPREAESSNMNGESTASAACNGINGGTFKMEDHPLGQNGRKLRVAMSEFLVHRRFLRLPTHAPSIAAFSYSKRGTDSDV